MELSPGRDSLKDLQHDFVKAFGHRLDMVNFSEELKTRLFKWSWIQKDVYVGLSGLPGVPCNKLQA